MARVHEKRAFWLVAGTILGMGISYYWPAEPAYAQAVFGNNKFAMCTVTTFLGNADAVFVLDMVTGRLLGAAYNNQALAFNQSYARNVAADFNVGDNAMYVMVPGNINLPNSGSGVPPANGAIYVGEMTSGLVCAYGFTYVQGPQGALGQPLTLIGKFPFRQAAGR